MDTIIKIKRIGITGIEADAIVNAANDRLAPGSGVCGAIFESAGYDKMLKACRAIGGCKTGSAAITPAFKLPAKYVIHAVGPVYRGGGFGEEELLYGCYRASLELAVENECKSIAFPLISAGIFGYPKKEAWEVAIRAILDFWKAEGDSCPDVTFCVLNGEILALGEDVLSRMLS